MPAEKLPLAEEVLVQSWTPQELWEQEYTMKKKRREHGYAKSDKPNEYAKFHEAIRTKWGEPFPAYGAGYKIAALRKAQDALKGKQNVRTTLDWVERGPANVPGRTRGVLIMSDDVTMNTWLAGSVAGGIWKTTDGGQSWEMKTPELSNLATTSLVSAAAKPGVIYAGTGESFGGYNGVNGDGIFKSTDGGETWGQLASTAQNDNFRNVNRLLIDQQDTSRLLAATSPSYWNMNKNLDVSKIMKTSDGGQSWSKVYESPKAAIEQIIAHPNDFNIQYAAINGVGVIKSTDAGDSWQKTSFFSVDGRIELAIAPTDPNRIYASVVGSSSGTGSDLYVSHDAGANWSLVMSLAGEEGYNYLGGQGWYDNTLAVNPFNEDEVYIAGVDMFRVRVGEAGSTAPTFKGVDQNNTFTFLSFVNFGADYFDGQIAKGSAAEAAFTNIEIRFGVGRSQKAHRFTIPANAGTNGDGGAGVPNDQFEYQDYVTVPFEIWDTDNNEQLMVSFRDQEDDGVFNLNDRENSDPQLLDNREYLYIHRIAYNSQEADVNIAKNGGQIYQHQYFMWPTLTTNGTWDPANLPTSELVINFGSMPARDGQVTIVCDAYNRFGGPNRFSQTTNSDAVEGVHPDHHNLVMAPMDATAKTFKIINANDGGLYVSNTSTEPGIKQGDWTFAGKGYNTMQLYGVDKKPGADEYIGGSQDNGTWRSPVGSSSDKTTKYLRALGGDGFEVVWHYDDPNKMMGSIYYNAIYRSTDGGQTWSAATSGLTDNTQTKGPFITKLANHKSRPDVVYAVGEQGVWKTEDFGANWTVSKITEKWNINSFTDVEVSRANPNIVWAGSGMSPSGTSTAYAFHVSTDGGKTFLPAQNYDKETLGVATGIFTHATEDSTAYAVFSFSDSPKILKSTDLGVSWSDITGFEGGDESINGFPDVAVYCLLVLPNNPDHIWVGTEIGLVESIDGGKNWQLANNGLPNVSIWEMKVVDDQVVVGTHARGIWSVSIPGMPATIQSPVVVNAADDGQGDLILTFNRRYNYDSTHLVINHEVILSIPASSSQEDTTVVVSGLDFVQKRLDIKAVGFVNRIDYPSSVLQIPRGQLALGFEHQAINQEFALTVYPNPANEMTNLRYYLPKASKVRVRVYDLSGRKVDELDFGVKSLGAHSFPYVLSRDVSHEMLIIELVTEYGSKQFKLLKQ
ncbi:MAG: hypothetical protein KY428_01710 [Bacteroidetes bacterium]|nr:hypothetical protein [Bacteroidota bacterium]